MRSYLASELALGYSEKCKRFQLALVATEQTYLGFHSALVGIYLAEPSNKL